MKLLSIAVLSILLFALADVAWGYWPRWGQQQQVWETFNKTEARQYLENYILPQIAESEHKVYTIDRIIQAWRRVSC